MAVCLFVQKVLPHFEHFTLCSNPFSSALTGASAFSLLGKLMALLWHRGSHAVQPLTHLCGFATIAFPSWKAKTSCGQNSTQRGFPIFMQPSHFSGKIVGYQAPHVCAIYFSPLRLFLQSKQYSVSKFARKVLPHPLHLTSFSIESLMGETAFRMSAAA